MLLNVTGLLKPPFRTDKRPIDSFMIFFGSSKAAMQGTRMQHLERFASFEGFADSHLL
jgi:hypothetical protein